MKCDTKTITIEEAIRTLKRHDCYIIFRKQEYVMDIMDEFTDRYYGSCGIHPMFLDKGSRFGQTFRLVNHLDNDEVGVYEVFYKGE